MTEETINTLCEKFHTTVDNLIPVYSKYMMTKDTMGIVISLVIAMVGVLVVVYIYRGYKKEKYDEYAITPFVVGATAAALIIAGVIAIMLNFYDCILWYNYPELRFLDTVLQIGGQMKVLVSRGYGAGWSTWNDPRMAFDERLIRAFECGITQENMKELCVECGYTDIYGKPPYMGGFKQLEVVDIPSGELFQIMEYDGSEYIEYFEDSDWYLAEGEYYPV